MGLLLTHSFDDSYRISVDCAGEFNKFDHVQTALTEFDFGHVRLGFSKAFSYVDLP